MKNKLLKSIFKKIIIYCLAFNLSLLPVLPFFTTPISPQEVVAACSEGSSSKTASAKYPARVGGVALDQAAKFLADMSEITGAYYDSSLDRIVFVGKKNTLIPKFDKDDLAVAIRAVLFNRTIPALSMEDDPADPKGPNLKVYYYGGIEDTRFGKVLLDADFKMKLYAQGYQDGQKLVSSVPGYKSHLDRWIEKQPDISYQNSSRWWILPQEITLKEDDVNSAFVFDTVKMQIKTEPLKSDNDPKWNQAAIEFAQQQTDLYDEFAKETPSYYEAKQLGKIVSIIKWLKDNNINSDFHWARDYAPKKVPTPRTMPRQTTPKVYVGDYWYQMNGGVEYYTDNNYQADTTGTSTSLKTSAQTTPTTKEDINWSFTKDGQQYEAVAVTADAFRSLGSYSTATTDLSIPAVGDLDLSFNRAYSSFSGGQQGIGRGWKFMPAQLFDIKPGSIGTCSSGLTGTHPASLGVYTQSGGWESFAFKDCTVGYVPEDPAYHSKISHNTDGTFKVTLKNQVQYNFDASYKLTQIKDIAGNVISYTYNGSGNVTAISDIKGHQLTLNYNPQGYISSVSDWSGRSVGYTYDDQGTLLSVTDPNGGVTKYSYDANFKLTSITDRLEKSVVVNTYSTDAKLATQQNSAGVVTSFTHDDTTKTITASDSTGRVNKTKYDTKGRVLEVSDPLVQTIKYIYNTPEFSPTTVTDKRNNSINYSYDVNGNLKTVTFPDTRKITYTYDAKNRLTQVSDNRYSTLSPKITNYSYDTLTGKVSQISEPNTTLTKYTYDSNGEILTITDPETKTMTWTRDSFGNPLSQKDGNLNVTSYEYDAIGRLVKQTDPESKIITYTYDKNSNLTSQTDGAGTTKNDYDRENRLVKVTLPDLSVNQYNYNNSDSLISVTDALTQTTNYAYDNYQNLTSQKDALDHTTSYIYDKLNQQTESKTHLGKATKWTYDPNGNILSRTDANNVSTTYIYDAFNRLTKITYPDTKTVAFSYDNRSNMISMVDPMGITSYTYDNFDRVTQMKNPFGNIVKYNYNKVDKLTRLTYPNNYYADYTYDSAHNLTNVKDWNFKDTKYTYYKNNLVSSRLYPNGIQTSYAYDSANRLSAITHLKSTVTLAKFAYARDAVGNITSETAEGSYIPLPKTVSLASPTPVPVPSAAPNPTGPDVVVTGVTLNPPTPGNSQMFSMTISVKNQGLAMVNDKLLKVTTYIDLEQLPDYKTPYVHFNNVSVTLNPGETKTYSVSSTLISRNGPHTIWAMVDQLNVLGEQNDNNNAFGPVNFTVGTAPATPVPSPVVSPTPITTPIPTPVPTPAPIVSPSPLPVVSPSPVAASPTPTALKPDLTVVSVVPSKTNPLPGESVILTVTIKNQGTAAITYSNYVYTGYYYDKTTAPTTTTAYNAQSLLLTSILPGATTTLTRSVSFSTVGNHNIWVMVDRNGTISELNETNNVLGPVILNVGSTVSIPAQQKFASAVLGKMLNMFSNIPVKEALAQTVPAQYISTFTYDPIGRLIKAVYPSKAEYEYTFDKADNRLTQKANGVVTKYNYDEDNKLKQTEDKMYFYDSNGNHLRRGPEAFLGDKLFIYDFENRLVKHQSPNDLINTFKYDGAGNRIEKRSFDTSTPEANATGERYVIDTTGPLSKVLGTTTLFSTYLGDMKLYGLGLISEGDEMNMLRSYPLEDGMGNTRIVTDNVGGKDWYTEYDPYGNLAREDGITDAQFKFKGEFLDDLSQIYFMRARYYDPEVGRFMSKDPVKGILSLPQTQNPYTFAVNDPINLADPSGEQVFPIIQSIGNACVQLGTKAVSLVSKFASKPQVNNAINNVQKNVPNSGGRLGGPEHRQVVKDILDSAVKVGYEVNPEVYVKTPDAAKTGRFIDLVLSKDGHNIGVQVGKINQNGEPVARERRAIEDLLHFGNNVVHEIQFVPYNK